MSDLERVLILGLGNTLLTDDGAGVLAARRAGELLSEDDDIEVAEAEVAGFALIDLLDGYQRAVIIDALTSGDGAPGAISRHTLAEFSPFSHLAAGHEIDLPTAVALAREMGGSPPDEIHIVCIEAEDVLTLGERCTSAVAAAVEPAARLALEIAREGKRRADLADYFGVERSIGELIPELLADFYDLGGFPDQIVELLRPLDLPGPETRVLDLACGKGAVSIALAEELGFRVHGIDLMQAFVEEAAQRARQKGITKLCHFERGDIREAVHRSEGHDAVLLISVGYVLGDMAETVAELRRTVREGGYIVVDDAFLAPDAAVDFPGYEHCLSHEEMIARLTAHGDEIVTEHVTDPQATKEQNRRYMAWIESRARDLAARHPEHEAALDAYLCKERAEIEILENDVVSATWVLRKP
jgi:hydrogenase maturation protease